MADRYSVASARRHGMTTRALARARFSWASLPAEIRLMVLDAIAQQKHPGWASSAAVCKEWQLVIERWNFRQLKLRVFCLDDFERLVVRQRHLVRHIRLDIELPKYTCHSCKRKTSESGNQRNDSIIAKAIWELFHILSTWEPGHGLTLELNAFCPSDSEHWFKNYCFGPDDDGDEGGTPTRETDRNWHDPRHGWVNGQQVTIPPPAAIQRLFEWVHLFPPGGFPRVDAVTCFIIRRQIRRRIFPDSLMRILSSLGRLEHLIYEPWRQWRCGWKVLYDKLYLHLAQRWLPPTLKSVTVFEDFSDDLAAVLRNDVPLIWQDEVDAFRVADPKIGAAFAARSRDLEQLSVSYMANAEDFFAACKPAWTWQRLQSLALTSQLLRCPERRQKIDALLYEAGVAALRMPRLRTLVIWNGGKGNACAFIYYTGREHASLIWRGTWEIELSLRVVEVWERVASESRSCELRVDTEQIDGVIGNQGDAIHHLDLPCRVVEPASLWQIRREAA